MKVLIVDDELHITEYIHKQIDWKTLGFNKVVTTSSSKQAQAIILEDPPELLITDIRMPSITGLDLAELIFTRGLRTKVIIMSGYSEFSYAQKALRFGAVDYLVKPVAIEDLLLVIEKTIDSTTYKRIDDLLQGEHKNNFFIEGLSIFNNRSNDYYSSLDLLVSWEDVQLKSTVAFRVNNEFFTIFSRYNSKLNEKTNVMKLNKRSFREYFYSHLNISLNEYQFPEELFNLINNNQWELLLNNSTLLKMNASIFAIPFKIDLFYLLGTKIPRLNENSLISEILQEDYPLREKIHELIQIYSSSDKDITLSDGSTESTIKGIENYIEDHFNQPLSLDYLGDIFHMHPVSISRLFKLHSGETFSNYLTRVRIEKAALLLENSNLLVKDISEFVGYNKTQYFIRLFKNQYGITPQKYRRIFYSKETEN